MENGLLRSMVYGAAIGDALGVPFESQARGSFYCSGMIAGGSHRKPKGTFSDDTSLLLATCDSIRATGKIDPHDMCERFCQWLYEGKYTADGKAFGMGGTTVTALDQGYGCTDEKCNGNGSLMRIAPLALTDASDDQIREVSAITHGHRFSQEACVAFVGIIRDVLSGFSLSEAIVAHIPDDPQFAFMKSVESWDRDEVSSRACVLATLDASLWCVLKTNTYADRVLTAVNLGGDTDTTACVAGALAGVIYGYDTFPQEWIKDLRAKDVIDACLF